jgi:uroporphyrinogen-III synthase
MSLEGKTILITRPREQSQELTAEIQRRGGTAVIIPMIRIVEPDSWTPCDAAIADLQNFDGIVFTSGNAVEKFLQRCELKNVFSPAFGGIEVFAVGERTEEMVKRYGLNVAFTPQEFSSASLQQWFRHENAQGKRFLFPKGNLSKEELPTHLRSLGAVVDEVDVYKNSEPTQDMLQEVSARFLQREFDVVTFASPSAIKRFHSAVIPSLFGVIRNHTKLAVIGPTTRDATEELGFTVDIEAKEATSKGLVDAIEETLATMRNEVMERWSFGLLKRKPQTSNE